MLPNPNIADNGYYAMVDSFYTVTGAPFLAHLSDLHGRDYHPVEKSLLRHKPELICVTGDIIFGSMPENDISPLVAQPNALGLLRTCASIAPTFVSLGNHEWILDEEDLEAMRSTGAVVLDNTWVEHDGLVIGGLTSGHVMRHRRSLVNLSEDERAGRRYAKRGGVKDIMKTAAELLMEGVPDDGWLMSFASVPGYHILLSHHPEYRRLVPKEVELILSGHAHGGQWRIFGHGVYAPGQGVWPKLTKGIYDGRQVVSAGLSNTAPAPRFFNPTQVVYVRS